MMRYILSLSMIGVLLAGCVPQKVQPLEKSKPVIYTVNYPLAYFAERIAGDQAEVVFPEMEGDPAFWEPSPEQIIEFQNADLILLNGADYAKWVPKVSLPHNRMVNTAQGLEDHLIAIDGSATHVHGPGGAHAHGDLAFTLWLNPEMAAHQAQKINKILRAELELDSPGMSQLIQDLQTLDGELKAVFKPVVNRPLLGSHPVYQYLAARYDLNMKSVHWEPDSKPDEAMWRELTDILEVHKADVILWEDEPLPQVKKVLAEKGIQSVVFNPCGNRPTEGDFLDVMAANVDAMKGLQ